MCALGDTFTGLSGTFWDLARSEALESRRKNLFGFLMAFCGYANALAPGLIYDDHSQIEQNNRSSASTQPENSTRL